MTSPRTVFAIVCGLMMVVALPECAAALDAGAATFESGARLYAPRRFRAEDVRVPRVEPPAAPSEAAPPDGSPAFSIERFDVVGNTLLPASQLERVLRPYLGSQKRIADVQGARDALNRAYEEAGFPTVAVQVPQQSVRGGAVRLDVLEARIGRVKIENPGWRWFSDRSVERLVPQLREGAIVQRADLEADLARANRHRDRRVVPVLKAGADPGSVDVELRVDDRIPLHVSTDWNNFHTPGTPRQRMTTRVSYENLWDLEHEAAVLYTFVPSSADFRDVQVWTGTYAAPLPWSDGQRVFAYAADSDTSSLVASGGLTSLGKGFTGGLRYSVELPELGAEGWYRQLVLLGVDYKDIESTLVQGEAEIQSPIQYLPWSIAYSGTVLRDHAFAQFRVADDFHFKGTLDGGETEDFQINRGGVTETNTVDGTYQILKLDANTVLRAPALLRTLGAGRFVDLPPPTRSFADDWTLSLDLATQYADEPLVSTEQFPLGGRYSVRGYLEGSRFGDHGWKLQTELRTLALRDRFGWLAGGLQGVAFWDIGQYYLLGEEPGSGFQEKQQFQSLGLGLRAELWSRIQGEVFVALPLDDVEDVVTAGDPQLVFQVKAEY